MRISELEEATGVSRATLKFYLREGLLPPGQAVSRTQAEYDSRHVERVRLIRSLTEVGELSLDNVRRVLAALDETPADRLGLMAVSQMALVGAFDTAAPATGDHSTGRGEVPADGSSAAEVSPNEPASTETRTAGSPAHQSRVHAWLEKRGWQVHPDDPPIAELDRAWSACEDAGIVFDEASLDAYADAVEAIALVDLDSVPSDPRAAVRQVVLGTVLIDPVLRSLRRLAQQHAAVSRLGGSDEAADGEAAQAAEAAEFAEAAAPAVAAEPAEPAEVAETAGPAESTEDAEDNEDDEDDELGWHIGRG
ncbi:MAG: MerR family transcriptional regulator [Dermatophilus congolensis]|nr:MerR family transcriptional regulator [Dermatophilus congolensis]